MLIVGTSIGGGVLMLPVLVSKAGFALGLLASIVTWAMMFFAAWIMVDEYLQEGLSNASLLSIYGKNQYTRTIVEAIYGCLYVALLVAYSVGVLNVVSYLFPDEISKRFIVAFIWGILAILILGGQKWLHPYNSLFTWTLLFLCVRMLFPCFTRLDISNLQYSNSHFLGKLFPLFLCSYGFHVILPTVCRTLDGCKKSIRLAIFYGSLITCVVYVLFLLGTLGFLSPPVLQETLVKNLPVTLPLGERLGQSMLFYGALISLFAMITSYLGVGEAFAQFLFENKRIRSVFYGRCVALLVPLVGVLQISSLLLKALNWAGIVCGILFGILPTIFWMQKRPNKLLRFAGFFLAIAFGFVIYTEIHG